MVRENLVACEVLSQLQRVMDNPRSLLAGECAPLRAGDRVRVYARRAGLNRLAFGDGTLRVDATLTAAWHELFPFDGETRCTLARVGVAK